jgi:hypothetical protein
VNMESVLINIGTDPAAARFSIELMEQDGWQLHSTVETIKREQLGFFRRGRTRDAA